MHFKETYCDDADCDSKETGRVLKQAVLNMVTITWVTCRAVLLNTP
jgi:hypothetical protein